MGKGRYVLFSSQRVRVVAFVVLECLAMRLDVVRQRLVPLRPYVLGSCVGRCVVLASLGELVLGQA